MSQDIASADGRGNRPEELYVARSLPHKATGRRGMEGFLAHQEKRSLVL